VMSDDLFFVNLPKDCCLVLDYVVVPRPKSKLQAFNLVSKSQLSSWYDADCDSRIFRCRKSSATRAKVAHGKLIANFGRPRFDAVKAVITHLGPPFGKPLSRLNLSLFFLLAHQRASTGSLAMCPRDVRFTPNSGHRPGLLLMSALCQKRTSPNYSMISSAIESNSRGTSMPSARAVCRLMTSSNLFDCKTGNSPGLAPLRMLPV
jgi:hypothetical protein